jgi:hypothetical protein
MRIFGNPEAAYMSPVTGEKLVTEAGFWEITPFVGCHLEVAGLPVEYDSSIPVGMIRFR